MKKICKLFMIDWKENESNARENKLSVRSVLHDSFHQFRPSSIFVLAKQLIYLLNTPLEILCNFVFFRSSKNRRWKHVMSDWNENKSNERRNMLSNKQTCTHSWTEIWLLSVVHVFHFAKLYQFNSAPLYRLNMNFKNKSENHHVIRM